MTAISLCLSVGAFMISLVSLYFSIRKQVFDEETATADQAAVLLSKLGEAKVLILKYRENTVALRSRCLQCGNVTADLFDLYDRSMDLIDKSLDLDTQEIAGSKKISYRTLKLKQGALDARASVLSCQLRKMDEMIQNCENGKKCEQNGARCNVR